MGKFGTAEATIDNEDTNDGAQRPYDDASWSSDFRRVQECGAKLAANSGIELDDIPAVVRRERAERTAQELQEAEDFVASQLAESDRH